MTQRTEPETKHSLHSLRDALEQAERQVVRLDRTTIATFLVGLDRIEEMFAEYGQNTSAVRAEEARWESLRQRITTNPRLVMDAAASAGGLTKLRSQHAPALGPWWHLDRGVAQQRTQTLTSAGILVGAIVVVALVWWSFRTFFPATPAQTDTTGTIEQLATAQQWPAALAAVTTARQTQPDDAELLVWEAVLQEQAGNAAQAQTSLAQAQQNFVGQSAAFWTLVGTRRQQVGNLAGADQAGQQALAAAPQDPQVTFLLGSVAEARGDIVQAADYFSQTIALAGDANPELGVIARVRMGNLSQRIEPLPNPAPGQPITQTTTP